MVGGDVETVAGLRSGGWGHFFSHNVDHNCNSLNLAKLN